jgi:hypothetical protein
VLEKFVQILYGQGPDPEQDDLKRRIRTKIVQIRNTVEASLFERKKWSRYGSPLFLNFCSILSKSAHDIRVANIEH